MHQHQSFGRRSVARIPILTDDDQLSVAPSVHEATLLIGPAASKGSVLRASLTVRTPDHAKKLSCYNEHGTLNDAQWARCQEGFTKFAKKSKPRPWFVTKRDAAFFQKPRKPRKQSNSSSAASVVGAGMLVRSNSVASASSAPAAPAAPADEVVDMEIDGEEKDPDEKVPEGDAVARATTNRWRVREYLQHDFAEYRSCCGSPEKWADQFRSAGLAGNVEGHCSHTPQAFFEARLKHRSGFTDRKSYDYAIATQLLLGKPQWCGYQVCCSCFRAALGIGRDALFRQTKLTVSDMRWKLCRS